MYYIQSILPTYDEIYFISKAKQNKAEVAKAWLQWGKLKRAGGWTRKLET